MSNHITEGARHPSPISMSPCLHRTFDPPASIHPLCHVHPSDRPVPPVRFLAPLSPWQRTRRNRAVLAGLSIESHFRPVVNNSVGAAGVRGGWHRHGSAGGPEEIASRGGEKRGRKRRSISRDGFPLQVFRGLPAGGRGGGFFYPPSAILEYRGR